MSESPADSGATSSEGEADVQEERDLLRDVNRVLHRITSAPLAAGGGEGDDDREEESERTLTDGDLRSLRILERRISLMKTAKATGRVMKKQMRKVVTGSPNRRVRDWAKQARVVKAVDKFSFVLGVGLLMGTEFVVLRYPEHYGTFYVVTVGVLMLLRLYMYARNKWIYFLLDFCYFANLSCFVAVLWRQPAHSALLWRLNFAVTNGPLLAAVLAWRNSLVFHSLDKVTSIAIHLLPALLTYQERWSPDSVACQEQDEACSLGFSGALLEPLLFYTFWQCLYILKTEIVDRKYLSGDPSIQTSFRWITRDPKNVMHRIALKVCRTLGILKADEGFDPDATKTKIVFWIGQLIFTVLTLLPVPVLWANQAANLGYLLFVLAVSIYNGANYYFEIFAARYLQKIEAQDAAASENLKNGGGTKVE